MYRNEVSEIKKLYTLNNSIRTLTGCYVNTEGEIISTFRKSFLSLEEDEIHKYLELLKKGLSGTIGKNICTYSVQDPDIRNSMLALRDSDLKNDAMLQAFYERIIQEYPQTENYAILLINNIYDVPGKGTDGFKNMDSSDAVYSYLQILLCPVKLEKPGLVYTSEENCFARKKTRWELQTPACSILYPSFEERSEDAGFVTCYSKDTEGKYKELLSHIFNLDMPLSPEEQMEGFQAVMETVLGTIKKSESEKIDVITQIQESVAEVSEDAGPSNSDSIELNSEDIVGVLQDIGISSEGISAFKDEYENILGKHSVSAKNLFKGKGLEVKTADIVIKIKPDKDRVIQSKIVDGCKCLVINLEPNETIEVNGINV